MSAIPIRLLRAEMTDLNAGNRNVSGVAQATLGEITPNMRLVFLELRRVPIRIVFVLETIEPEDVEAIENITFEFEVLMHPEEVDTCAIVGGSDDMGKYFGDDMPGSIAEEKKGWIQKASRASTVQDDPVMTAFFIRENSRRSPFH
jgi:hypothetical protein